MRAYKERGATILMTTHYMEEAETLCDRVGIISEGRLLALDTVSNLRSSNGFEFKVTFNPDGVNVATHTIFGTDDGELVERVRQMGIRQFSDRNDCIRLGIAPSIRCGRHDEVPLRST